jgi:hypothetical protein
MSSTMITGGHNEHNYLFKQGFVGAVNTPRVTVLRNVLHFRLGRHTILYSAIKDTSHVVIGSHVEGTCTTEGTCPYSFTFFWCRREVSRS